jgi:uncharacterized membrane protein (DUF106 family)
MTQFVVWLNSLANILGALVLAPLALLPGWLSATVVAAATGLLMLLVFKYTSNQAAIKRVRSSIKANLLALSLFKDNIRVSLRAQSAILLAAGRLLLLALAPMLVMLIPMCLALGQLALWYQARPLQVGEETVVTVQLSGEEEDEMPEVSLDPGRNAQIVLGPVRAVSRRMVCFTIRASEPGYDSLSIRAGNETATKELAVGNGFMRVSPQRPGWNWSDALLYPQEAPFAPGSALHSVSIEFPSRTGWATGSDWWIVYWFVVSMIAALFLRKPLNVNL